MQMTVIGILIATLAAGLGRVRLAAGLRRVRLPGGSAGGWGWRLVDPEPGSPDLDIARSSVPIAR